MAVDSVPSILVSLEYTIDFSSFNGLDNGGGRTFFSIVGSESDPGGGGDQGLSVDENESWFSFSSSSSSTSTASTSFISSSETIPFALITPPPPRPLPLYLPSDTCTRFSFSPSVSFPPSSALLSSTTAGDSTTGVGLRSFISFSSSSHCFFFRIAKSLRDILTFGGGGGVGVRGG